MASGFFFPGVISAHGVLAYNNPPGTTIVTPYIWMGISGPQGWLFNSGTVVGSSISGSGTNHLCGATITAHLNGFCLASDGNHYTGHIVSLSISGPWTQAPAAGAITAPLAGVLNDMPQVATGTGWVSTVTLRDLSTGADTALSPVGGPGWSAALPALAMGRICRVSATFIGGPSECVAPVTRTLEFSLPALFTRVREWAIVYPIGPALIREWAVTYPINRWIGRRWAVVYRILSPPGRPVSEAAIAAALRPLHTFRARLWVRWDGTTETEETERLLSASGVDDIDAVTRAANSAEAVIELDNSDDRFTPVNVRSPIHANLHRIGHEVRLAGGYDGHEDTIFIGRLESLHPRAESRVATLRALDRTSLWRALRVSYPPAALVRTDQVMRSLLTSVGLTDGVDFVLDVGDVTIPYAIASMAPLLPELQALAQVEGGRLFIDAAGVLRFWSRSHALRVMAVPVVELNTDDHLYEIDRGAGPAGLATRITMEWVTRDAAATEIVYRLRFPLRIPGGHMEPQVPLQWAGPFWHVPGPPVVIRCEPMDLTRWEQRMPAVFEALSLITANAARDGTGATIATVQGTPPERSETPDTRIWWTAAFGTGFADITLRSMRATPGYVTALELSGRPQRSVSPTSVTISDPDAAAAFGAIEARLSNPYTPDADVAADRVAEELAGRRDPVARLAIPLSDGLPFLRTLDVLRVSDLSVPSVPVVSDAQVLRNNWRLSPETGYTQDLLLVPALPARYRGAASLPAVRDSHERREDGPPWRWAGPYSEHHVKAPGSVIPWQSSPIRDFPNAATLLVSADVPPGNPTPHSVLFRFTGEIDPIGLVTLPAPMRAGIAYTVRFWLRRLSGTGSVQWIVGDRDSNVGGRAHAWNQVPPAAWEERIITWTPSADCPDPVFAFTSWGAITSDVVAARLTVTHGAPVKTFRWTAGGQWQ